MKTYLRLLSFHRKGFKNFITGFTIYSILYTIFGLLNFGLIAPLLDILFNKKTIDPSLAYIKDYQGIPTDFNVYKDMVYYHIGNLSMEQGPQYALLFLCSIIFATTLFSNIFRYLSVRILEKSKAESAFNMRVDIFKKISTLPVGFFTEQRKGDIISRATNDVAEVEFSVTSSLGTFLRDPIKIIFYFWSLFTISANLTFFTLLFLPIAGGLVSIVVNSLKRASGITQRSLGFSLGMYEEAITGTRLVKAFNASNYIQSRFTNENYIYTKFVKKISFKKEAASPVSEILGIMIMMGILIYGGNLVFSQEAALAAGEVVSGGLSPSSFIAYIVFFSQVISPVKSIAMAFSSVQKAIVSGDRIFELLDEDVVIKDKPNAEVLDTFKDKISFSDVFFNYVEGQPVLSNINFDLKKGTTVALVGMSGGGKSTIADLVPRFYDVTGGEILLDGKDVKEYTQASILKQMGIVTQESILFNDTIVANIAFGVENPDMEKIHNAAKAANAHEFILATEDGYHTVIGDRGQKLSGGQRQRLSIARAIYKNPPILILDEATSALDTESEKLVQDALINLMDNRTSLVIAHRLSTIQHADLILVLDQGQIIERGTHDELMTLNGAYRKLQEMQQIAK